MKLNYKLKVCLMALAFTFIGSTAMATNIFETEIISKNSDNWVEIKNENGIKVFIQRFEENGKLYLNVKFNNITNEKIEFSWTLINGQGKFLFKGKNTTAQPKSDDTIKIVPIKKGTLSGDDCSISINIK